MYSRPETEWKRCKLYVAFVLHILKVGWVMWRLLYLAVHRVPRQPTLPLPLKTTSVN
jgi:hypothetical protein